MRVKELLLMLIPKINFHFVWRMRVTFCLERGVIIRNSSSITIECGASGNLRYDLYEARFLI
jgi:hypothetical protein